MGINGHIILCEDYVSFETAKLLKEKGFPQNPYICNTAYTLRGKLSNNAKSFVHNFVEFDKCGIKPITYSMAPTLQMAMKWLREEYKIYIDINISIILEQWSGYNVSIYKTNTNDGLLDTIIYRKQLKDNTSYEEACEAAIKYCLENLI